MVHSLDGRTSQVALMCLFSITLSIVVNECSCKLLVLLVYEPWFIH